MIYLWKHAKFKIKFKIYQLNVLLNKRYSPDKGTVVDDWENTAKMESGNLTESENFNFHLSYKKWKQIKPKGNRNTLRQDWTDLLAAEMNNVIPGCVINLKSHYISTIENRSANYGLSIIVHLSWLWSNLLGLTEKPVERK